MYMSIFIFSKYCDSLLWCCGCFLGLKLNIPQQYLRLAMSVAAFIFCIWLAFSQSVSEFVTICLDSQGDIRLKPCLFVITYPLMTQGSFVVSDFEAIPRILVPLENCFWMHSSGSFTLFFMVNFVDAIRQAYPKPTLWTTVIHAKAHMHNEYDSGA